MEEIDSAVDAGTHDGAARAFACVSITVQTTTASTSQALAYEFAFSEGEPGLSPVPPVDDLHDHQMRLRRGTSGDCRAVSNSPTQMARMSDTSSASFTSDRKLSPPSMLTVLNGGGSDSPLAGVRGWVPPETDNCDVQAFCTEAQLAMKRGEFVHALRKFTKPQQEVIKRWRRKIQSCEHSRKYHLNNKMKRAEDDNSRRDLQGQNDQLLREITELRARAQQLEEQNAELRERVYTNSRNMRRYSLANHHHGGHDACY